MTTWPPLREVIARHGLAARRALGQHFLLDANLTQRIVRATGDLAGRHVVEIGPGPGGLTRALLASAAASVTVVEIDQRAVAAMDELAADAGGRLHIVAADALSIDVTSLVPSPRQVIANLPYNIATPLLIGWLRQASLFERLTLMFQQEVAERICAAPGTAAYGRLSVLAQWTCATELLLRSCRHLRCIRLSSVSRRMPSSRLRHCSRRWNGSLPPHSASGAKCCEVR
jgi:16S rRNA (adenine1518-N6/adenine1519-N6)-dimethyltransferase